MKKIAAVLQDDGRRFLIQNKGAIIAAFVFAVVCYGFMLTHFTIGIDEETWIMNTDPELIKNVWVQQGRFGLFLFDSVVTPMGGYIPFFSDFFGVVLWTAAGVLFAFCVTLFWGEFSRFSVFVFCAMFPSVPLAAGEILSFSMFSLQQGLAMLLAAFGVLCIFLYFRLKARGLLAAGAALALVATSFYQAFAGVFLTALAAYALICVLREEKPRYAVIMKNVLWGLCAVAVGVGIYALMNAYLTTYVAPGGQGYLSDGLIGWGNSDNPLLITIRNSGAVLFGVKTYGGSVILAVTTLFLIFTGVCVARKKGGKHKALLLLACMLLLVSPFFMALLLAQPAVMGRTLLALPFAMGIELFLVVNLVRKTRILRVVLNLVVCVLLLMNAGYMNLMFFNGYLVYEKDKATSAQMMERVSALGYNRAEAPVIFVGKLDRSFEPVPDSSVTGSFFSWDGGNNGRLFEFFKIAGYPILPYTRDQFVQGVQNAADMPCWPMEGSVQKIGDCILIKLSEPDEAWYGLNIMLSTGEK